MHYAERESLLLAPYAMHAADSAGRRAPEPDHPYRSPYQRDRDRITHSSAFRRLSQKTQVFTGDLAPLRAGADYHRTRLTHTLEVASIARTIARALRLNEDLVETLALGHDVGHPPFGHAGEEVLNERLAEHGGFNHNRQAMRLFERLEIRYPDRPGLNLSSEVLESQYGRGGKPARSESLLSPKAAEGNSASLLEAQVVDAADSIAYDSHDADDALEMGLLTLDDLQRVPLWRESAERVRARFAALTDHELRRATVHELIDRQVGDLVEVITTQLRSQRIESVAAVLGAGVIATHSKGLSQQKLELEGFLFRSVYRHPTVLDHRSEAADALNALFDRCLTEPNALPAPFDRVAEEDSLERAVGDYVSSLTDRAVLEGRRALA